MKEVIDQKCPVCEHRALVYDCYPIEHWICHNCGDVFVKDSKFMLTTLPGVKKVVDKRQNLC